MATTARENFGRLPAALQVPVTSKRSLLETAVEYEQKRDEEQKSLSDRLVQAEKKIVALSERCGDGKKCTVSAEGAREINELIQRAAQSSKSGATSGDGLNGTRVIAILQDSRKLMAELMSESKNVEEAVALTATLSAYHLEEVKKGFQQKLDNIRSVQETFNKDVATHVSHLQDITRAYAAQMSSASTNNVLSLAKPATQTLDVNTTNGQDIVLCVQKGATFVPIKDPKSRSSSSSPIPAVNGTSNSKVIKKESPTKQMIGVDFTLSVTSDGEDQSKRESKIALPSPSLSVASSYKDGAYEADRESIGSGKSSSANPMATKVQPAPARAPDSKDVDSKGSPKAFVRQPSKSAVLDIYNRSSKRSKVTFAPEGYAPQFGKENVRSSGTIAKDPGAEKVTTQIASLPLCSLESVVPHKQTQPTSAAGTAAPAVSQSSRIQDYVAPHKQAQTKSAPFTATTVQPSTEKAATQAASPALHSQESVVPHKQAQPASTPSTAAAAQPSNGALSLNAGASAFNPSSRTGLVVPPPGTSSDYAANPAKAAPATAATIDAAAPRQMAAQGQSPAAHTVSSSLLNRMPGNQRARFLRACAEQKTARFAGSS